MLPEFKLKDLIIKTEGIVKESPARPESSET
jgi:hypothetical protein